MGRTSTVRPEGSTFHWSATACSSTVCLVSGMGRFLLCEQIADRQGQLAQDAAHVLLGHRLQGRAGLGRGLDGGTNVQDRLVAVHHLDVGWRPADMTQRNGRVRLKDCKSAKGKTYNATVLLDTEPDGRSKFSLEFENGGC